MITFRQNRWVWERFSAKILQNESLLIHNDPKLAPHHWRFVFSTFENFGNHWLWEVKLRFWLTEGTDFDTNCITKSELSKRISIFQWFQMLSVSRTCSDIFSNPPFVTIFVTLFRQDHQPDFMIFCDFRENFFHLPCSGRITKVWNFLEKHEIHCQELGTTQFFKNRETPKWTYLVDPRFVFCVFKNTKKSFCLTI